MGWLTVTNLSSADVARYHADGFLIVRGVFSRDELARFSAGMTKQAKAESHGLSAYEIPELENLWSDTRLLQIAGALLGEPPVYFGEGGCLRYVFEPGQVITGRHLHHDGKGSPRHLFARANEKLDFTYPVVRLGIYFEDYARQSGGLKVTPGSHRMDVSDAAFVRSLESYNVPSEMGDVVCFCSRVLHSPFGMRLKGDPELALHPLDEDVRVATHPDDFLPVPKLREAIFTDYAAIHEWADVHIKGRALKTIRLGYSQYLVDRNKLSEPTYRENSVRVDNAMVEAAVAADYVMKAGGQAAATPYLKRVPALCRLHWETSPHYVLHDSGVSDDSLATAFRLVAEIMARKSEYAQQLKTVSPDLHMKGLSLEEHHRLRGLAETAGS